ncbi:TIGR03086 family metal-binding protein [Petropleomorpha daqingensis]|uniref:Uncharacterized protein (TIGR03086 family) n=1 Tax=Petropleomorpha daqingensis TaxID=2026353 RepID=A0A853CQ74_9ACTN|nr:TIGR03086 family metal-binding protein [Petropleomorpha daqingensis]NYJ08083.1 uncharacterized protein (TIGR03086 family) [Petropleomorpha daqingensis]
MTDDQELAVLRRGLDQLERLVADVRPEAAGDPTPCTDWTVRDLVDHVVATPARFARMVRDEPIDWTAPTPPAGDDPAGTFRAHADDLLGAWREQTDTTQVDWQCAELAVHTWDLATAVHADTSALDPEVAERGLAFMQASLTPDNRGPVFGPEQPAPEGADVYGRIAAFAGRSV